MRIGNDTEIEIKKGMYNRTQVQEDGVTQIVDPTPHTLYRFEMSKNYFDIEDKKEVIIQIIGDLKAAAAQLEGLLEKDKSEQENEFEI
jgi:hypothetical protein